jgi:hypothetical protein
MVATTGTILFGPGTLTATQTVIATVVYVGVSMAVTSALTPKPNIPDTKNNLGTTIDSIADADIVYGQIRKGGTKTYHETTGNGKFYHYFITLAMHEVEEIGDIYINDEIATINSDNKVVSQGWNSKILIRKFTGSSTQNIYSTLVGQSNPPTNYTNQFKGRGVACLYVRLEYDQNVFQSGMPLITAVVKGKKVYDPRKDSTSSAYNSSLGQSTQRKDDDATWTYSPNAALVMRDYLVSSQGVATDTSQIDDDMIGIAADDCASVGVSGSEDNTFEVNGSISTGKSKKQNLNDISKCMNGTLFWAQGKFRLVAGAYHPPTITDAFTLDDVRSAISIQTRFSRRDLVNTVRGTFIDKDNRWIADDYPEQQLEDMTEDNNVESIVDLPLPLVTSSATAQRLAKQVLYTSREQIVMNLSLGAKAYQLQVGDTIKVTMDRYSWTNKIFAVKSWRSTGGDGSPIEVQVSLQETSSTAYNWSISSDEYQQIVSNNTSLDNIFDGLVISTLNLSAGTASTQPDGTVVNNIACSWTAPSNGQVTHYEFGYKTSTATNYTETTVRDTTFLIEPAIIGKNYDVRVRAVTSRGNTSTSYKTGTISNVTGVTTAPSVPTFSSFTATGGYKQVFLDWVNPTNADLDYVEIARVVNTTTTVIGRSSGTTFTDSGRANSTSYVYKIRAVNTSGVASSYSSTRSATTEADNAGPAGARGAGIWTINLATNDMPAITASSSAINTLFVANVANPVNKDQARFTDSSTQEQRVWLYNGSTWAYQAEVIDGNLIVGGSIDANALDVDKLSAISANLGNVTVEDVLQLQAGGAGFIGGRTAQSAYDVDGFLIARTDLGGGSKGFEVSHTSVVNNKLSGIIHQQQTPMKLFNPTFLDGGSISGGTSVITTSTTTNIGSTDEVDITVYGAGGGGGAGKDDGYYGGSGGSSGGSTTAVIRAGSATGTVIATITATGGSGGSSASIYWSSPHNGQSGQFGVGGGGGGEKAGGGTPPTGSWGAGGGGAGGDDSSIGDSSGGAGEGGFAGQAVSRTIDTSAYTGDIFIITTIGAGGAGSTEFNYTGGTGAQGAVAYASPLGGTTSYQLVDFLEKQVLKVKVDSNINYNGTYASETAAITLPKGYYRVKGFQNSSTRPSTTGGNHYYNYLFELVRGTGGNQTISSGSINITNGNTQVLQINYDPIGFNSGSTHGTLIYFSGNDYFRTQHTRTGFDNGVATFQQQYLITGPVSNVAY